MWFCPHIMSSGWRQCFPALSMAVTSGAPSRCLSLQETIYVHIFMVSHSYSWVPRLAQEIIGRPSSSGSPWGSFSSPPPPLLPPSGPGLGPRDEQDRGPHRLATRCGSRSLQASEENEKRGGRTGVAAGLGWGQGSSQRGDS